MPKAFLAVGAVSLGLIAGSAVAKDTDEDAQLREALHQKMLELNQASSQQAAPITPAPKPAPAAKSTQPEVAPLLAPAGQDDPETIALREALNARLTEEAAKPVAAPEVAATAAAGSDEGKGDDSKDSGYAPLTAPALPISAAKEQRLQQLLEQYKADQITPQEYHAQRAKIIAE